MVENLKYVTKGGNADGGVASWCKNSSLDSTVHSMEIFPQAIMMKSTFGLLRKLNPNGLNMFVYRVCLIFHFAITT